jgi:hypothetical protein
MCLQTGFLAQCRAYAGQPIFVAASHLGKSRAGSRGQPGRATALWVCPVSTDCLPLSRSTSSHSSFLVLSGAELSQCGMSSAGVVRSRMLMPLLKSKFLDLAFL